MDNDTPADRLLWKLDELNIDAQSILELFVDTYGIDIVTPEMVDKISDSKYRKD